LSSIPFLRFELLGVPLFFPLSFLMAPHKPFRCVGVLFFNTFWLCLARANHMGCVHAPSLFPFIVLIENSFPVFILLQRICFFCPFAFPARVARPKRRSVPKHCPSVFFFPSFALVFWRHFFILFGPWQGCYLILCLIENCIVC